jgi:hypothetical protein
VRPPAVGLAKAATLQARRAVAPPPAIAPPRAMPSKAAAPKSATIQRMMSSSSAPSNVDIVREFNDLELIGSGKTLGTHKILVPRKPGELVAYHGATTLPVSTLGSHSVVKLYDAARGRDDASPKLRSNADDFVKQHLKYGSFSSSHMGNQAQHVLPFATATNYSSLFSVNTEHPFNAQFLPEKDEFLDEILSVEKPSISQGIATFSSSTDFSSLTGSFHQGYHSAYNKGMAAVINEVLKDLCSTNAGKPTAEMVEAAMFVAERGGRAYASRLLPLYRSFNRQGVSLFVMPHWEQSEISALKKVGSTDDLASFIGERVFVLGK